MKVVINAHTSGVSLSHEAVMRYAELSGIVLYPYLSVITKRKITAVPYVGQKDSFMIHYLRERCVDGKFPASYEFWFLPQHLERTDPNLVRVIEELGDEASRYSEMKVVEIPDGVDFYIDGGDEDMGPESIHEVHRVWD